MHFLLLSEKTEFTSKLNSGVARVPCALGSATTKKHSMVGEKYWRGQPSVWGDKNMLNIIK